MSARCRRFSRRPCSMIFETMNAVSSQPTLEERVPKQLRAAGQVLARSRFASVSGGYSSAFPAAGCVAVWSLPRVLAEKAGRSVGSLHSSNDAGDERQPKGAAQ